MQFSVVTSRGLKANLWFEGRAAILNSQSHLARLVHSHAMSAADAAMLRACCLLLCLATGSLQLSITEFEVPVAVQAGEDASLLCRYSLNSNESDKALFVKWWWTRDGSDDRVLLYQRIASQTGGSTPRHNIKIKEDDTIELTSVQPTDSGTYECEVSNIDEVRKHQDLIVYTQGSGPQVNVTISEDNPDDVAAIIECTASKVAPLPTLSLSVDGAFILNATEVVTGPDNDGLYEIITTYANYSKNDIEGSQISCELFYVNGNVTHNQYIDVIESYKSGDYTEPTTEVPEETTVPDATQEPLQDPANGGHPVCSWIMLIVAMSIALCSFK